ncbi:ketopantoate reductase family protein [Euzebya tangerina]|uniref:ketopantoate reductase family protein n=1 Tax=Euzebya tangerina TaxID=591198 RepID=UPI000E3198FA|nr:2-dehydropantoate 2-reductase [Euzebya tangerina]
MTRVLIAGAGSLGTVYGAFLASAGYDVQLLARPPHARQIERTGGVEVRTDGTAIQAGLQATDNPSAVAPADIVILLCKAPDTDDLLDSVQFLADDVRLALSLQNGTVGATALRAWCNPTTVVGGVSMVGATLIAPGIVAHTYDGPTYLGPRGETGADARHLLGALAADLDRVGLRVTQTERIESVEWSKLIHASPSMALTALTRLDFHHLFVQPELADVFLDMILEGVAIATASDVSIDDWPQILPIRTLADLPREEALDRIRGFGDRLVEAGQTDVRISMLQSVERGRTTEVEAIHGHLVRAAETAGVTAPVTQAVYRILAGLDRTFA